VVEQRGPAADPAAAPRLQVKTFLPASDVSTRQALQEGLWHLSQLYPIPEASVRELSHANWAEAWKEHFKPLAVGQRLQVVPVWSEAPASERLSIRLEPGMAFGTGLHPSTRLCLMALEERVTPGGSVLDVGSGSGILSIAAAALGARSVTAMDIDPAAVEATRANARLNGFDRRIVVLQADVAELSSAGQWDAVVANLLAGVITRHASNLAASVAPGGWLMASGVLADQAEEVEAALEKQGLEPRERRTEGDWALVSLVAP
jgi:ribosomal protein L11 methyltransferase